LDPTEEEAQLATGMLLCACIPALGSTTNVWQTGRILPAKAIQVNKKLLFPSVRRLIQKERQGLQLCQERCIEIHQIVARALHEDESSSPVVL
jgi:exosome complex component MTR3